MSRPPLTDVPGLFILHSGYEVDTRGWRDMLRDHAGSCKLQRIEFCKTRSDKLHEFLVLYFSHHTHPSTSAVVIVDRAAQESSQTSAIVSPSLPFKKTTPALDKVHVMGQNVSLDAYLSHTYGKYNTLCVLEYPSPSDLDSSTPQPPSAIQLSILLLAVTEHKSDYNLYEHNCYWFADMVFEASKKLFPGHREVCYKHEDRGRCRLNIAMLASATPALEAICREYDSEWGRHVQMRGLGRDGINQHEWERRLEEACRGREEERRGREEERRGREEERRAREEERRAREEERRGREEERRAREAAEQRCKQLQAKLEAAGQA